MVLRPFKYWGQVRWVHFDEQRQVTEVADLARLPYAERLRHVQAAAREGRPLQILPAPWVTAGQPLQMTDCLGEEFFDDLCCMVVHYLADMCYHSRTRVATVAGRFRTAGYVDRRGHLDDAELYRLYEEAVISYAQHVLGPEWIKEYDYWGAVCLCHGERPRGDQRKNHLLAGDTSGRIAWFDSFQALEEHLEDRIAREGLTKHGSSGFLSAM